MAWHVHMRRRFPVINFKLNGADVSVDAPGDASPVRSCQTQAQSASGRDVTTLAGLQEGGKPSALQQAFIEEQAAQCGYCISGMIIVAQALLDRNPNPTDSDVRTALANNLCRCGTHNRIVRAVLRASKEA